MLSEKSVTKKPLAEQVSSTPGGLISIYSTVFILLLIWLFFAFYNSSVFDLALKTTKQVIALDVYRLEKEQGKVDTLVHVDTPDVWHAGTLGAIDSRAYRVYLPPRNSYEGHQLYMHDH